MPLSRRDCKMRFLYIVRRTVLKRTNPQFVETICPSSAHEHTRKDGSL